MIFKEKEYVKGYAKTWFPMWQEYKSSAKTLHFFKHFRGFLGTFLDEI